MTEQLAKRPGAKHLRLHVPSPDDRWKGVSLYGLPGGPNLETGLIFGEGPEGAEAISAFPVARDGIRWRLDLHPPRVWENLCEAVVFASDPRGAHVPFFDVGHLHPWNEEVGWASEDPVEVRLAAFAYHVEPLQPEAPRPFGLAPRPWQDGHPDDHLFAGTLRSVARLTAWGQPFYRLELDFGSESPLETEPRLPVYVAAARLPEGWKPRIRESVCGMLWLQGTAVPFGTPIISSGDE